MLLRVALLLAFAAMIAACGPIPQPFKGSKKVTADVAMLDVPSAVGIAIVPVSGIDGALNADITKAIATQLQAYEIPAEAMALNTGLGFTLQGTLVNPNRADGIFTADIVWRLKSRTGKEAGFYLQGISLPVPAWDNASPEVASRIGREAAKSIAGIIDVSTDQAAGGVITTSAARKAEAAKPIRISVKPVDNAPGDGREALQLDTLVTLLINGAKRDDVNPEVVLMSRVLTEPASNDQDFVTISWRAISQDGTDLGEVKLTNTIPRGSLDGRWGPTAFAIAEAGLAQLLELLATAPRF
jgi:hypothetical protein